MLRIGMVCLLFLAVASAADAASMTVGIAPRTGSGPYASGSTVVFDVSFTNNTDIDMVMRLFQLNNTGSDVAFTTVGTDTVPSYRFTSPITSGNQWTIFRPWSTIPQAGWAALFYDDDPESEDYNALKTIKINAGATWINDGTGTVPNKTGAFGVIAPDFECCDPPDQVFWSPVFDPVGGGWCAWAKVDIVSGPDADHMGRVQANGLPGTHPDFVDLLWGDGGLDGGMGWFYCVPEPASLGLLGLGMLVVLRRRR